jgi:two-component system, NarL family, response regulator DevR
MIRLMIIDDHEMVREGLKAILVTEPDFSIVGLAANAEEALILIERLRPDVALLDVRLPGVSGIEVCRIVTEQYPETAVIILTTFTDEQLIAQSIQAGAKGFILKDVERFDLKRAIRAVARGEAAIDTKTAAAVLAQLRRVGDHKGRPYKKEPLTEPLSSQQIVILRLVAQGLSSREIATQLYLSENTVKGYVQEILHRLGVKNRTEAVMVAVKQGWL